MLAYAAAAVALAGWLCLLAYAAVAARPGWTHPGPPSLAPRGEPPAVVSLLAGRLDRDGFAATLLDLAARGWLTLHEGEGGRLICRLPVTRPAERLAPYEAMAVEHLALRADVSGAVPVAALADDIKPVRRRRGVQDDWRRFRDGVRAEAVKRGLVSRLPGGLPLIALWVLAAVPVALGADAIDRTHGRGDATGVAAACYLVLVAVATRVLPRDRPIWAGRTALAEWLGARPAATWTDPAGAARTAVLTTAGERSAGYAVALGTAPAVAAAFRPDGNRPWSSYGGRWHQVTVGGTSPRRAGRGRLPAVAEVDGQIVKRWIKVVREGEEGRALRHYVAIDDGRSDRAWALLTPDQVYHEVRVGMPVRAQVNPRRNWLIGLSPRETGSGGPELARAAARQSGGYRLPAPSALVTAEEAEELIGSPACAVDIIAGYLWRPEDASEPRVLVQVVSNRAARLLVSHASRRGQPVTGLAGASGWLVSDGRRLLLHHAQGTVSVILRGRPASEAELALTRLAPVIAARLPAPG
jgi:hypothetical protein